MIITNISTGGSGGEDRLTENVTINFAKVNLSYVEQGPKGGRNGGPYKMGWDIPGNKNL